MSNVDMVELSFPQRCETRHHHRAQHIKYVQRAGGAVSDSPSNAINVIDEWDIDILAGRGCGISPALP